uniref:C2H2-type domain-containing protein n=2 Tax=Meloidogyne incognita TaxID=6306 RepID=A0A914MVG7_MELIC
MPYRTDLKRPDLKGQFPCSVCNKIFCHSSSLSRHRMQAHYKSYTCTQCNQDIHNSENLRSHMYRCHQIHRMFMCRCCNWAFPDKTSLHIHMQSMQKSGKPGDVSVLARSSLDPDVKLAFPDSDGSTTNSCPEDDHQIFPEETGEISELEEQQHLQKLEETNNIREQTQRTSQHQLINNNFGFDENKKDFLLPSPLPQNSNIQTTTGIFPPPQNQQQQRQNNFGPPNFSAAEMLLSKLGGFINNEEKQLQQHNLLQNNTPPTAAQTLLATFAQHQNSHQTPQQHQLLHLIANNPYLLAAAASSPSPSSSVSSNNDFKNIMLQHPNHHFPHPPPNHLPIATNISPQFANTNVLQSLYAAVASAASAVASTSNSASISNSASATNCSSSVSKQPLLMENIKHKKQKLQPPQKKRRGEKRKSSLNNAIIKNKNSATTTTMPTMDLSLQILQKGQNDRGAKTKKTSANNEANQEVPPNRCESLSPSMGKLNSLITNLLAIKGGNNNNNNIKQEHSPVGDDYDGNNGGESSSASERRNKRKMRTPARAAEVAAALINEKKLVNVASASNENNNNGSVTSQPSPAVSDSQTSSGGSNGNNNDEHQQQQMDFEANKDDGQSTWMCSSCQEIKTRFETKDPLPPLQSLTKLQDNIVQLQSLSERIVSLASIKGENNSSNDELLENAQKLHRILISVVDENQINES